MQKIKEIEECLFKLEERISNFKKRFQDDFEHKNLRDIRNLFNGIAFNEVLFNQSIDKDYYNPIRTKSAFNSNYIEYESKAEKKKNLLLKEYLYMIIPYLRDMINDHNAPKNLKVRSLNEVFDYEFQYGEWKIQLTM